MKKIKLLTHLITVPMLGSGLIPLTSCKGSGGESVTQYTITLNQGEHGTLSQTSVKVDKGKKWSEIKLSLPSPVCDTGWSFKEWTLNGTSISESYEINSNITIVATYIEKVTTCTITLDAGDHGEISKSSLSVEKGKTWGEIKTTISNPKCDLGWIFKEWRLDGKTISDTYVINDNITIFASYKSGTIYTITYNKGDHGTIDIETIQTTEGTLWKDVVKPTVTPDKGYKHVNWINASSAVIEDDYKVAGNFSATANYELEQYSVLNQSSSDVTFTNLPSTIQAYQEINATYTFTTVLKDCDETNSDILIGSTSIKSEQGVVYKNGTLTIPANLVYGNVTIKIVSTYKEGYINTSWSNIINACNTFEASDRGSTDISAFLSNFTVIGKTLTKLKDLVGAWTVIKINDLDHIVRIIDTQHDVIATGQTCAGKTSALTFEMVTCLSDASGDGLTSKWDLTDNYDYTNSVLRWNLNGAGSGTRPSSGLWDNSALSLLPSELQDSIKIVNKKVATTSSFTVTTYTDKLFPLTDIEMGGSASEYIKTEGTAYTYWVDHGTSAYEDRIKKDANGTASPYWLVSPVVGSGSIKRADCTNEAGIDEFRDVSYPASVSFAFCI